MFICKQCKKNKLEELNSKMRVSAYESHTGICAICGEKDGLFFYEKVEKEK